MFDPRTTRSTSRSQLIHGLDTNIHCLTEEGSEWIICETVKGYPHQTFCFNETESKF